jgi:integrase
MKLPFLSPKDPMPPLTDAECESILNATGNSLRMALIVGFNSGISQREVLSIRRSDVDFKAQAIEVPTKDGSRRVVLPSATMKKLEEYVRSHDSIYLFPLPDTNLSRQLKDVGRRGGIELNWQRVRSTYIKNAAKAGVPILTCAHNVGTNPANILSYFRLSPEEERNAINQINSKG